MSPSTQRLTRRMAAGVLLWLLIPAGAQVGIAIYDALHPGAGALDPNSAPPSLLSGVIGLVIGAVAAIAISLWLRLGMIWFGIALLVAALLGLVALLLPSVVVIYAMLLLPPIIGALAQWRFDERRKN
nr:hypothetical protein [Tessaracoccus bendigoensis]